MPRSALRRLRVLRAGALLLLLPGAACIFRGVRTRTVEVPPAGAIVPVRTSMKVHLRDGSTVLFRAGAVVRADSVVGAGERWNVALAGPRAVAGVPTDSVAAMEAFDERVNVPATIFGSAVATAGGVLAAGVLAIAIFGSCPTIYTDSAGTARLEAESFSYSIAPLFARRDVDALRARPDSAGRLVLEVRNEALETHYIDHLEVLAIAHRPGELVLPGRDDRPVALDGLVAPASATDRAGRDVRDALLADDARTFATDSGVLARASVADPMDHVELAFDASGATGDSVALVLTLRNSLLNTVLLYDVMLGASGASAVEWMGRDLGRIDNAVALGRWYGRQMGLRIEQWRDGAWVPVASIGDAGPIAWRRVAVPLAHAPDVARERLRLSYVADQWRIDRVALAGRMRTPSVRAVPVAELRDAAGVTDTAAAARLRAPDERYLMQLPGRRVFARFDVGRPAAREAITTMVAAQGYYIEWIRGDWVRAAQAAGARTPAPFVPGDSALGVALDRWRLTRARMERDFEASRIPVR